MLLEENTASYLLNLVSVLRGKERGIYEGGQVYLFSWGGGGNCNNDMYAECQRLL